MRRIRYLLTLIFRFGSGVAELLLKIFKTCLLFTLVFSSGFFARAQNKGRVETIVKSFPQPETSAKCGDLKAGKLVSAAQPDYPVEAKTARVGGTVLVNVKLNEKGSFAEIGAVSGNNLLHGAAVQAAQRVKFSPTVCDNSRVAASVILFYNFVPAAANAGYFRPSKIEELTDVKNDSQFYEPILNLTENYRLAFGYADKKFYPDATLTRGDFAEFLRRTLDLLSERAKNSSKLPREIGLFFPFNPQSLKTADRFKDLDEKDAYSESIKVLLLTYDIAFTNEKLEVKAENALTRAEVVDLWTRVFGAEAVPVNSVLTKTLDDERLMTRGEFALFLQESLNVLTYKVLP